MLSRRGDESRMSVWTGFAFVDGRGMCEVATEGADRGSISAYFVLDAERP